MTGQTKPYWHKTSKRWVVSISDGKHPDGRRRRRYFYAKTPEAAVAAAHGARSPDRVVAIDKIKNALGDRHMGHEARAALLEAISELEVNL